MTTRKSAVFSLAVITSLVAACSEGRVLYPEDIEVEIARQAMVLDSGVTDTLAVFIRNATNPGVTWTSLDEGIATVDAGGVVTGIGLGVAMIVAASVEDPSAVDSVSVSVVRPGGEIVEDYPVFYFRGIWIAGTSTPVRLDSVSGPIDLAIHMKTSPWAASRLELWVDQTVVVTHALSSTPPRHSQTIVLTMNTAELDAAGKLRFPNGAHTVSARLVGETGVITASSSQSLTFRNSTGSK